MAKKNYTKAHQRNLNSIQAKIDRIFAKATQAAAKLGASVKTTLPDDKMFNFDDYPELKKEARAIVEELRTSIEATVVNGVNVGWQLSNEKNDDLARQVFGDKVDELTPEQRSRYFNNNADALEAFRNRVSNGLNLSDRVWDYSDRFKTEIELGLDLGIRSGQSAAAMTRSLREYLREPNKLFRRVRDERGVLQLSKAAKDYHPGRGVYRSSYKNARRLAATETNIAYRTSDHLRWQQADYVVGIEVKLSNNHTVRLQPGETTADPTQLRKDGTPKANAVRTLHDICDELQGRYPKDFKFTGWHPHCRCYAISILKTEEERLADLKRIARGEPLNSESVNAVHDTPEAFNEWVKNNADRINQSKSLPYFIRDNQQRVNRLLGKEAEGANSTANKYVGQNVVERIASRKVEHDFAKLQTHDEVCKRLSKSIEKQLGYPVEVSANPQLIDLDSAKAYAVELIRLTKKYKLEQRGLGKIEFGYTPEKMTEIGEVYFEHDSNKLKVLRLRTNTDSRDSKYAVGNSRCEKSRIAFAPATHEFGHIIYQVKTNNVAIPNFEQEIYEIYKDYKFDTQISALTKDYADMSEWYLGNYADIDINEFIAEAFQEYVNCKRPTKYALLVGNLINRYFSR